MSSSDEQLKLHVEAIETLLDEKKELADYIKERYALVKGEGFDVKVFKEVIKRRAMERAAVEEQDALVVTYESALG